MRRNFRDRSRGHRPLRSGMRRRRRREARRRRPIARFSQALPGAGVFFAAVFLLAAFLAAVFLAAFFAGAFLAAVFFVAAFASAGAASVFAAVFAPRWNRPPRFGRFGAAASSAAH